MADSVKQLMEPQLTEREAIFYLLVESGKISMRELAVALGTSHSAISLVYNSAKEKVDRQADAGIFATKLEGKSE